LHQRIPRQAQKVNKSPFLAYRFRGNYHRMMPRILVVSKPLSPPWNDSGKNLARDLVLSGRRYQYHVMVPPEAPRLTSSTVHEEIYQPLEPGFALSFGQKARVLWRLMRGGVDLFHFFFAPNPASSNAARLASFLRQTPSIQTICSAPKDDVRIAPLLFGKKIIVLSKATKARLLQEDIHEKRLAYIPPGICLPEMPSSARRDAVRASLDAGSRPIVLFPGDYEVSTAAQTFARAILYLTAQVPIKPLFVFACRTKTAHAKLEEQKLRELLTPHLDSVRFVGEVDDIYALLAASSVVTLPAESLYAKMDAPLVLLEAMSFGVPVIVANKAPLSELVEGGSGVGVAPGDEKELAQAIKDLIQDPARRAQLGEAGKKRVQSFYSAKAMAEAYEALYDEVLSWMSRDAHPHR
jgi:glycosyltransferase involved in cell wall biosynthesis